MKLHEIAGRPHTYKLSDGSSFRIGPFETKTLSDKFASSASIKSAIAIKNVAIVEAVPVEEKKVAPVPKQITKGGES